MGKAVGFLVMHGTMLGLPLGGGRNPGRAAAEAGLSRAKLAEVDKFMEHQVADKKIAGGIVIVAHDGKIGFFHAYGQMDVEANQPTRPDTIFRIYSMSKAITTAAALNLVDAGKIGVDDPVSKYIPSFADLKVATPSGLRAPNAADDRPRFDAAHIWPDLWRRPRRPQGSLRPVETAGIDRPQGNDRQARPDSAGIRSRHRLDLFGSRSTSSGG